MSQNLHPSPPPQGATSSSAAGWLQVGSEAPKEGLQVSQAKFREFKLKGSSSGLENHSKLQALYGFGATMSQARIKIHAMALKGRELSSPGEDIDINEVMRNWK